MPNGKKKKKEEEIPQPEFPPPGTAAWARNKQGPGFWMGYIGEEGETPPPEKPPEKSEKPWERIRYYKDELGKIIKIKK